MVQDKSGYIWIASSGGLQRYDGVRFKTFRSSRDDSSSFPNNIIFQVLMEDSGNFWLLFNEGRVGMFDTRSFKFTESKVVPNDVNSLKTSVMRLVKDDSNHIFLLLGGAEVLTLNRKANIFSQAGNFFTVPGTTYPADFIHQPNTPYYWISLQNGELVVYNRLTGKLNTREDHEPHLKILETKIEGIHPSEMFFDKNDRFWFTSWGPGIPLIYCWDLRNQKWIMNKAEFHTELKTYYEVKGFFQQCDGTIWTKGARVMAWYDEKNNRFRHVENSHRTERSISFDAIQCLYEDAKRNIWVGSENDGLYRFNPEKEFFLNVPHANRKTGQPGTGSVLSVMPTGWGTVFTGAWGDGLYEYDLDFNLLPLSLKKYDISDPPSMWSMAPSRDKKYFWMSAQPGIYKVNRQDRSFQLFQPDPISRRTIRQLVEDNTGSLWMGLQYGGVYKWQADANGKLMGDTVKRINPVPPLEMVNKVYHDSHDQVWVATATAGVYVFDAKTDSLKLHFSREATDWRKLPETGVSSVLQYDEKTYIITTGTYVLLYKTDQQKIISIHDFRDLSVFIASSEKDRNGYVWISTTGGLFRYNILNDMFVWFRKSDGIDNENFSISASRMLDDGRMVFGSSDQFIVFDPSKIDINNSFPEIKITDIRVHNKSMLVDSLNNLGRVEFEHHRNSMVFEFSSLTFGTAYIDVKYKLEGMDPDWLMADEHYQAVYSYLPPGNYSFLVRSENAEGTSGNKMTRFNFTILRPFYQTWWFYSILALLAVLLLYWFDRERMKRTAAIQQMRSSIADNLHDEVTTTLNNITILSEIARLKADKDLEKSKEYIDQINDKSRKMMYNMEDVLWSIDPENDSMEKMLLRMREYAQGYEKEFEIPIELQMDPRLNRVKLDMLKRQELFFIFKDAMNCMIRGFRGEKVSISMDIENKILVLKMRAEKSCDDAAVDRNCIHLKDIRKRAAVLKAPVEFIPDNRFVSLILQVDVG